MSQNLSSATVVIGALMVKGFLGKNNLFRLFTDKNSMMIYSMGVSLL